MKKRILSGIFLTLISSTSVFGVFGGGSGTEANPYHIWDPHDLVELSRQPELWDKHFIQMADLDLGDPNLPPLTPIGNNSNQFTGGYNGNGQSIKNIEMTFSVNYGGVFGYINHATISKLTLINPKMTGLADVRCVGCLCGIAYNSTIEDCAIENGSVTGGSNSQSFGLLVGSNYSTLNRITCSGTVSGFYNVGGVVGYGSGSIYDSSFSGTVSGHYYVGGFGGTIRAPNVFRCFSEGSVSGASHVGGFAGSLTSEISDCYSQCNISGYENVGGFNGYSTGPQGRFSVIKNCYASGIVSGTTGVGGMTGYMSISEYSNPTDFIGCFWDAEVNAGLPGIGNSSDPELLGESTVNMQTAQTFINAGWDFAGELDNGIWETWMIEFTPSYPTFSGFPFPGTGNPNDPYLISTANHLRLITENEIFWSSHIKMTDDIDLEYEPIAHISIFRGVFDGDGHSILHFGNKDKTWDPLPLFLNVEEGVIKNLTYINPYIKRIPDSIYSRALTLSEYVRENSMIVNCHVINGHLEADPGTQENPGGNASGFIGTNEASYISQCSFQGTVIGFQPSGFIGSNNMGTITDCSADVNVQGEQDGSGFIAYNGGQISRCSTKGTVRSNYNSAGFIGHNDGYQNVDNPQYDFQGYISECSSFCSVYSDLSMNTNAAGFVVMNINAVLENCCAQGTVSGYWADGFSGLHSINHMGTNAALINCYSSAQLTGTNKRGLVASLEGNASIQNCFWDTQTSGTATSAGGTGKTTAQMQTQSTFTNWDFNTVWGMGTYPVLQWELSPLQPQIDAATDGDVIIVQPGIYTGRLYIKGKNITLASTDPTDPDIVAATILQGVGVGPVVTFDGTEHETCVLTGFTVTGGATSKRGGGICGNGTQAGIFNCTIQDNSAAYGGGIDQCHGRIEQCIIANNSASANGGGFAICGGVITNCLVYGNSAASYGGGLHNCNGSIVNCTISDNKASSNGGGVSYSRGIITNCVIWGNSMENVFGCSSPAYSCWAEASGEGNIVTDPLFVDSANRDYHLLPDSPCIDAGDPASDFSLEPKPNGGRVNVGAYGNTDDAALSQDGLVPLGFEIINKIRTGRTVFTYELAVTVQNTNDYAMEDVLLQLVDADDAVLSVQDDQVALPLIGVAEVQTSRDTFSLTIDRSEPIITGRLAWKLTYYVQGQAQSASLLTMPLSAIDLIPGDITGEGDVNLKDFAALSQQWQQTPGTPSADIAQPLDNYVGIEDLLYLTENWLGVVTE
ncbi:MAG: hypothetical protein JXD22_11415 [Sedimentisphaerales bacterium]|nr:hypothetical protein [Sedimentisphaerales bacterium]